MSLGNTCCDIQCNKVLQAVGNSAIVNKHWVVYWWGKLNCMYTITVHSTDKNWSNWCCWWYVITVGCLTEVHVATVKHRDVRTTGRMWNCTMSLCNAWGTIMVGKLRNVESCYMLAFGCCCVPCSLRHEVKLHYPHWHWAEPSWAIF